MSEFEVPTTAVPFALVGTTAIIAGGIVAAVTGPTGWDHGSWVAAFLVLVVGVGQIGLGLGQATSTVASHPVLTAELVTYNIGSALVVVGTLVEVPAVVTVGGANLIVALATFLVTARRGDTRSRVSRVQMALLVVLLVSVPIGIALSWVRT